MTSIQFTYDNLDFYPGSRFVEALQSGKSFQSAADIQTEVSFQDMVEPDWTVISGTNYHNGRQDVLFDTGDAVGYGTRYKGTSSVYVRFCAESQEIADAYLQRVIDLAPPIVVANDGTVDVSFWAVGAHGPQSIVRKIETETWAKIGRNYSGATVSQVEQLLASVPPFESGRLILWHGIPGTGKSHAIRALVRHWRPWCDVNYIVDPDVLFRSAASLMSVLLDNNGNGKVESEDYPEETFILQAEERWRVFIMEDCDEFLQADAKSRQGQALSRLLNVADGFIGQGLKVIFLITTNEKIANIHAAVSRTGRCAANTEFTKLSQEEANNWLGYKDKTLEADGVTLSDLYDKQRKQRQIFVPKTNDKKTGQYL